MNDRILKKQGYRKHVKSCTICFKTGGLKEYARTFYICQYCHVGFRRMIERYARSNAYMLNDIDRRLTKLEANKKEVVH